MFDELKHIINVINRHRQVVQNDLCMNFRCLILYLAIIIIAVTQIDRIINVDDIVSSDEKGEAAAMPCIGSMNVRDR
jgi:hypothetical protein